MPVTLDQILASTRAALPDLLARRAQVEREAADQPPPPPFAAALRRPTVALIAEVKRRSPSAGDIRAALDPGEWAERYVAGGAAAVSVLTDGPYFGGSLEDLRTVAARLRVPVLRKDFILDEAQVVEARAAGAAAVLLIVRALPGAALRRLVEAADAAGVEPLVEVHDRVELERALEAGARVVGINSRDLVTFAVDPERAWTLLGAVPAGLIAVAESGMDSVASVSRAADAGADAVLVGTALSRAADPTAQAAALASVARKGRGAAHGGR